MGYNSDLGTKHINIHITGIPEREERKNGAERLLEEIMDENFPYMRKEMNIQIQELKELQIGWT